MVQQHVDIHHEPYGEEQTEEHSSDGVVDGLKRIMYVLNLTCMRHQTIPLSLIRVAMLVTDMTISEVRETASSVLCDIAGDLSDRLAVQFPLQWQRTEDNTKAAVTIVTDEK